MHITNSSRYVKHKGKPVVAVWGLGFTGVAVPTNDAQTIIDFFKASAAAAFTLALTRVKAEGAGIQAALFRQFRLREEFPDIIEGPDVYGRIRAWRLPEK